MKDFEYLEKRKNLFQKIILFETGEQTIFNIPPGQEQPFRTALGRLVSKFPKELRRFSVLKSENNNFIIKRTK